MEVQLLTSGIRFHLAIKWKLARGQKCQQKKLRGAEDGSSQMKNEGEKQIGKDKIQSWRRKERLQGRSEGLEKRSVFLK